MGFFLTFKINLMTVNQIIRKILFVVWCWVYAVGQLVAQVAQPEYSVAGFFPLEGTGRAVYSMNPSWRFMKGDIVGADQIDFDDTAWEQVSLPHGIELLPTEASGCINYQGVCWYRKHFELSDSLVGAKQMLYFEAVMGVTQVWINGELCKTHFGGYLPIVIDVTGKLHTNQKNVIAVKTDNSNNPLCPPGKPQEFLDFTYCGGIYRDCWLIVHNDVFLTDETLANKPAGGGLFVSFDEVSEAKARINYTFQLQNERKESFSGKARLVLYAPSGKQVSVVSRAVKLKSGQQETFDAQMFLKKPQLWAPSSPSLYQLHLTIIDSKGRIVDGYRKKIGIRSIEFKGEDGLWLNGKPYPHPLIGVNRHQDFAVIGNALSNSLHWRDAKKLKALGLEVIRNAHYPQDPAFMDACDALGLFVIENTPGWQYWNENPIFQQRVFDDIRHIVRRERNRPSVFLWEPVLNETWFPESFVDSVVHIVKQEYPYPYCYLVSDSEAKGADRFRVLYAHPAGGDAEFVAKKVRSDVSYFTREWGDNVDDWNSHNSTSRVNRVWGEIPMLVQAEHYAQPAYGGTCYNSLWKTARQHVGGCLWHSFDHQRGYHPDPFYGGLMDAFRQPKYSYYVFKAQRPVDSLDIQAESGPMIYIAHEMTPFSPKDVTVYSNCEEVRLTVFQGGKTYLYHREKSDGMPSPVITFKDVYHFMDDKALSRKERQEEVFLLAEGYQNGKKVAEDKRYPSRRPAGIRLHLDDESVAPVADGADLVTVVASVVDEHGQVKRLNNYHVRFHVEGEARLVADEHTHTNPRAVQWGTAPVLLRTTQVPGLVRVRAEVDFSGMQSPASAVLEFTTLPAKVVSVYDSEERKGVHPLMEKNVGKNESLRKGLQEQLREVERQQTAFGENN